MSGKQKKSGYDFTHYGADRQGRSSAGNDSSESPHSSSENEPGTAAGREMPSSEFPISEGSDASANEAMHPDIGGFQETLTQSAQEGKRRLAAALDRGYAVGGHALEEVEDEMSTRPWSTFFAGAVLGGIAGFLIATRR